MESIMSELPLMLFTSCVLLGAGGFTAKGIAALAGDAPGEGGEIAGEAGSDAPAGSCDAPAISRAARSLPGKDAATLICLAVVIVGFIAAFFHLANPLHAVFALTGIGRSPMSNEIAVGSVFTGAACVYCVLAMTGNLKRGAQKACSVALGVLGLVFAAFTGAAYMMDTIVTWATPLNIVESAGISLLAGSALFGALKVITGGEALSLKASRALFATAAIGAVVGLGALCAHALQAASLHSGLVAGATLVQAALVPLAVAVVAGLCALALSRRVLFDKEAKAEAALLIVVVVVAVLAARIVFYSLQLSVGL